MNLGGQPLMSLSARLNLLAFNSLTKTVAALGCA